MRMWVRTNTSNDYHFECFRFEIFDGIVHFYDEDGDIIWVIKDWIGFRQVKDEELKEPMTPDEFYNNLKDEKDDSN